MRLNETLSFQRPMASVYCLTSTFSLSESDRVLTRFTKQHKSYNVSKQVSSTVQQTANWTD